MDRSINNKYPIQFGRYRLLKKIGSGGMAKVYRAEMQSLKRFRKIVAIKILHMHFIEDPHLHQLFFNEARLGGFLKHPNIIETYDFNEHNGRYFLAMEYVNGLNLNQIISRYRVTGLTIPFDVALQLMIQTCRGLDYAHKATDTQRHPLKMVHRDLKPSNILINNYGQVKIADFGVARAMSNINLIDTIAGGMIKGTIRYLSPEQALRQSILDNRSDIFTAGLILFELLTNRFFYDGNGREQVFNMTKEADIALHLERLPNIPFRHKIINILYSALSPKKQDRFSSAMKMARAIEKVLACVPAKTNLADWHAALMPVKNRLPGKRFFALSPKADKNMVAKPSQSEITYTSGGRSEKDIRKIDVASDQKQKKERSNSRSCTTSDEQADIVSPWPSAAPNEKGSNKHAKTTIDADYYEKGWSAWCKGDFEEAVKHWDKAAALNPKFLNTSDGKMVEILREKAISSLMFRKK
jgi:serine/threonine protein kinase